MPNDFKGTYRGNIFDQDRDYGELLGAIIDRNNAEENRMISKLGLVLKSAQHLENIYTSDIEYRIKEEHTNPYGNVHGGIVAALFDTGMGLTCAAARKQAVTTTDISISYLRALSGDSFTIHVEVNHIGAKMVNAIARIIENDTGKLCSTAIGSYIVLPSENDRVKV